VLPTLLLASWAPNRQRELRCVAFSIEVLVFLGLVVPKQCSCISVCGCLPPPIDSPFVPRAAAVVGCAQEHLFSVSLESSFQGGRVQVC
jgi:hypothetical protein